MEKYGLVLLGAIIGFLSSIAKDHFMEKNKRKYKEIELKREKAEELYLLLTEWSNMFFSNSNHLSLVMKGDIDYNQYLDYIIERDKVDFKRIEMLTNVYFKNLLPFYKLIEKDREILNNFEYEYRSIYEIKSDNDLRYVNPLMTRTSDLTNCINNLKNEIILYVNKT